VLKQMTMILAIHPYAQALCDLAVAKMLAGAPIISISSLGVLS
jgi:hypothetical protein